MPLEIGQVLENKYRIVRLIGQGGMGAVYEGENVRIRRRVAIKVLHAMAAENPELIARFEHEAQAAGQIGSDHILEVLDLGVLPDGDRYLVMEYLDGEPLSDRIHRMGRLQPADAVPLLVQVLAGLAAAHRAGIVHRDLKPENIFILREKAGQADFIKIIDFGISKFQSTGTEMRMTRTGAVLGTPYYMSPEQASGKAIDARSDIYSVGVILYEALTGCTPFVGNSYNELILKIVLSTPPPAATIVPDLPPALCAIVEHAMGREPEQRFQSAEEFGQALVAWGRGKIASGNTVVLPDEAGFFAQAGGPFANQPGGWRGGTPGGMPYPGHTPGVGFPQNMSGSVHSGMSAPGMGPVPMGTPAGAVVSGGSVPGGAWSQTGTDEPRRKSRHGRWIALAVGAVVVCCGLVVGAVRFARNRASTNSVDPSSNQIPAAGSNDRPVPSQHDGVQEPPHQVSNDVRFDAGAPSALEPLAMPIPLSTGTATTAHTATGSATRTGTATGKRPPRPQPTALPTPTREPAQPVPTVNGLGY